MNVGVVLTNSGSECWCAFLTMDIGVLVTDGVSECWC